MNQEYPYSDWIKLMRQFPTDTQHLNPFIFLLLHAVSTDSSFCRYFGVKLKMVGWTSAPYW